MDPIRQRGDRVHDFGVLAAGDSGSVAVPGPRAGSRWRRRHCMPSRSVWWCGRSCARRCGRGPGTVSGEGTLAVYAAWTDSRWPRRFRAGSAGHGYLVGLGAEPYRYAVMMIVADVARATGLVEAAGRRACCGCSEHDHDRRHRLRLGVGGDRRRARTVPKRQGMGDRAHRRPAGVR
jgi:hypothetical protein